MIKMPKNDRDMMRKVNLDVYLERCSQNEKWGEQQHTMAEWLSILVEEVGETAQAINRINFPNCAKKTDADDLYKELIHASAVASAMAEQVRENAEQ